MFISGHSNVNVSRCAVSTLLLTMGMATVHACHFRFEEGPDFLTEAGIFTLRQRSPGDGVTIQAKTVKGSRLSSCNFYFSNADATVLIYHTNRDTWALRVSGFKAGGRVLYKSAKYKQPEPEDFFRSETGFFTIDEDFQLCVNFLEDDPNSDEDIIIKRVSRLVAEASAALAAQNAGTIVRDSTPSGPGGPPPKTTVEPSANVSGDDPIARDPTPGDAPPQTNATPANVNVNEADEEWYSFQGVTVDPTRPCVTDQYSNTDDPQEEY